MSMMYCNTHDNLFDTDWDLECPMCVADDLVFCYYCSCGHERRDDGKWPENCSAPESYRKEYS